MKIVIAPDSFKESITALEASHTIEKGMKQEIPNAAFKLLPMADGGEGTLETLIYATKGMYISSQVTGPLGNTIRTKYGRLGDGQTAVIEVAHIAGLTQVPLEKRNPLQLTTYGIGEVISDALTQGYRQFIIGLGGSATNDGGLGMLQALGALFTDDSGEAVSPFGAALHDITNVDVTELNPALRESKFIIASDVKNPLCGQKGASFVFGAQKGATPEQIQNLDRALSRYAQLIELHVGRSFQMNAGAGAAGGLGFACMVIGAEMRSGARLIAETIGVPEQLVGADFVITGEGTSDEQTMYGKVPAYIGEIAHQQGVKPILISGSLGEGYEQLYRYFIGCYSIVNGPMTLEATMENTHTLLYQQARNIARMMTYLS